MSKEMDKIKERMKVLQNGIDYHEYIVRTNRESGRKTRPATLRVLAKEKHEMEMLKKKLGGMSEMKKSELKQIVKEVLNEAGEKDYDIPNLLDRAFNDLYGLSLSIHKIEKALDYHGKDGYAILNKHYSALAKIENDLRKIKIGK